MWTLADWSRDAKRVARLRDYAFPEQLAFIDDTAKRKSLLCPRRAGKSEADGLHLLIGALTYPETNHLYCGLTQGTCRSIMWPKLRELNSPKRRRFVEGTTEYRTVGLDLGIPLECFNESRLELRLENGSVIRMLGMDATEAQREKALGDHYKTVIGDEAASFRTDLKKMFETYLEPATMDDDGTIALTGTPDPDEARGFFYAVTEGKAAGWSRHNWSTLANPGTRAMYAKRLAQIHEKDPAYEETDEYRCMWQGLWPRKALGRVYQFAPEVNFIDHLPANIDERVIAIDLGWDNATAISEVGWSQDDPTLYVMQVVKLYAEDAMIDRIAARAHQIAAARGSYVRWTVDGANKTVVEELRRRYGLPLEATDKSTDTKAKSIRMFNTDLQRGKIRVLRGACADLVAEWAGTDEAGQEVTLGEGKGIVPLIWDKRAANARVPRREEDPRCANDASDSVLYAWRMSRAFMEVPPEDWAPPTDAEKMRQFWAEERERLGRETSAQDWG